jgi:PIN domain nuclease of toxin-antitoxin system
VAGRRSVAVGGDQGQARPRARRPVSAATLWEIAIKQALGKIAAPADLPERVRDSGFRELPIGFSHAIAAGRLPLIHRDPFDRMLVAQARCEDLTLVTRDPRCQQYDVAILPA